MPHLIIEHSANVTGIDRVVAALHDAALATGIAPLDALRTRAAARDNYAVADRHPDNGFVAVTARFGAGRSDDDKQRLLSALIDALDEALGESRQHLMLSVEYQDINPDLRINRNHLRPLIAERGTQSDDSST